MYFVASHSTIFQETRVFDVAIFINLWNNTQWYAGKKVKATNLLQTIEDMKMQNLDQTITKSRWTLRCVPLTFDNLSHYSSEIHNRIILEYNLDKKVQR